MVRFNQRSCARSLGRFEQLEPRRLLAGGTIELGPQTGFYDQPYVEVALYDDGAWIGPKESGYGIYPYNRLLLDTGANSVMVVSDAASDLASHGYQTEGLYHEQGVAGYTEFDVSAGYRFDVTGTDGVTHSLPQDDGQVRVLSDPGIDLGGFPAEMGGIPGIVGMPAMVDRVTTLDLTSWLDSPDIFEITGMEVIFSSEVPAGAGHRYSVAVDNRVSFDVVDGLPEGSPPDAPLPVWAPIPFMTVVAEHQGQKASGNFLLDTGAQMSMISTAMAIALGLDEDGDGNLDNEKFYSLEIGGVGGTKSVPVVLVDKIALPTQQGVDLAWMGTEPEDLGLELLVLDIAPGIDGVFGVDLLTGGITFDLFTLELDGAPYFEKMHFDFRDMNDGSGTIYFDLNAQYDEVIPDDSVEVTGRHIFYNNSAFDGRWADADVRDDAAIATDKQALRPGETATFANYTSYSRGINGIMIDVDGLADPEAIDKNDFLLKVGNSDDPASWTLAPEPALIDVRMKDGIDRITIIFADNAIEGEWLQVTVRDTAATGLAAPDVFYFGNAIGEAGDSQNALVNATDEILARNHHHDPFDPAGIEDRYDFNRDRLVNATDQIIARSHQTGPIESLGWIHPPGMSAPAPPGASSLSESDASSVAALQPLDWLLQLQQSDADERSSPTAAETAVDRLLATYWE